MRIEKCKGKTCDAQVQWHKTVKGKWMPFDAKPVRMFVLENRETIDGAEYQVAVSVPTMMPHHATCPDVEDFRRKQ